MSVENCSQVEINCEPFEFIITYNADKKKLKSMALNKLKTDKMVKITGMGTMINFVVQLAEQIKHSLKQSNFLSETKLIQQNSIYEADSRLKDTENELLKEEKCKNHFKKRRGRVPAMTITLILSST